MRNKGTSIAAAVATGVGSLGLSLLALLPAPLSRPEPYDMRAFAEMPRLS